MATSTSRPSTSEPTAARQAAYLLILAIATLSFALEQTAIAPALDSMAHSLRTSGADVIWVMTSALVADAVLTPVLGKLGDMFGKRRVLVVSLGLFAVGGAISALANGLGVMIVGRVLQGFGSAVFPLGFGIARDVFPARRRTLAIGLLASLTGMSSGLGPVLGGLFVDRASYRWIFVFGTVTALIAAAALRSRIPESAERTPGRVDVPGAALLTVGLVAGLLAISQGNRWHWSDPRTLGLLLFGVAVLVTFVLYERGRRAPLVNIGLLATPTILLTNVTALLIGFGMLDAFSIIPRLSQAPKVTGYGFGTTAVEAGALLLPGSLLMVVTGPLAGVVAGRVNAKLPFVTGAALTALGLTLLAVAHGSPLAVICMATVLLAGIGFAFAALPILIINATPAARVGEATGVNTLMRSVGTSLGAQVAATILAGTAAAEGRPPTDHGYTLAFVAGAIAAGAATVVALFISRSRTAGRARSASPAGDASAPPELSLSAD
jgi:MFS family permease